MRLILASASPRRAELLRAAGFMFEVVEAGVDERVRPGEAPDAYVRRLASEKSGAVLHDLHEPRIDPWNQVIVVGADTAVVIDGDILGKPLDDGETASMLRRLSGRRHEVLTGVSVRSGETELWRVESTAVQVAVLTEAELAWYVKSGEGRDKAGGYAVQGLASRFIQAIDGSYSNVVGLPVAALYELLRALGAA